MSSNSTSINPWGPYSGATDFNRNMLIIVLILIFAIFFFTTSRFLYGFRLRRAQMQVAMSPELKAEAGVAVPATPVVFAEGVAGQASECAICLCEFVEGDGLRVLRNCKHCFHDRCVEVWLSCGGSCPTCRTSCVVVEEDEPPGVN